jgi:SAM-dependent methyltransferase
MPDTSSETRDASDFDKMYSRFTEAILAQVRRETYGEDLGQYSWTIKSELEAIFQALGLGPGRRLLDVACGAGGPARFAARTTGCDVVGVDNSEQAIATASRLSREEGLQDRARFEVADAGLRLPFADASFDAVLCVDAIVLLPGRPAVFQDWSRLLRPGGRVAFTDPGVVTGLVTLGELSTRTGDTESFCFSTPGDNERLLREAGLALLFTEDATAAMDEVAGSAHASRSHHRPDLEKIEGKDSFQEQQLFYETTHLLARERRQSRLIVVAERPMDSGGSREAERAR